jgi:hypothetical protein
MVRPLAQVHKFVAFRFISILRKEQAVRLQSACLPGWIVIDRPRAVDRRALDTTLVVIAAGIESNPRHRWQPGVSTVPDAAQRQREPYRAF